MITENEILPIGKIIKSHKTGGEMIFAFFADIFDNKDFTYYILDIDGIFVPFFIDEYKINSAQTAWVKIDGINNQKEAKYFVGKTLYAPIKFLKKVNTDKIGFEYFNDFEIYDKSYGFLGKVIDIDQTTANILLIIQTDNRELLIPFVESYIIDIDHNTKEIFVNLPQGLIDL
ncbi:MAG: ribosome maturation factor RimM [Paludibacter sp.]|nr:ribosome maturation factor RimM [Paludibacter sp.]